MYVSSDNFQEGQHVEVQVTFDEAKFTVWVFSVRTW